MPSTCPNGIKPSADGLIDDFEDGDNQLARVAGRDGYWFISTDEKGSTVDPSPLSMSAAGAAKSAKAVHVFGHTSGEAGAWGAQVGANFLSRGFYDASKYRGISFKAKTAGDSTKKFRFKVGDVNTHPDGGVCKTCWNQFGTDLSLTTDWVEYKIMFTELKQEVGWGDQYPAILPSKLVSVNWSIGPGRVYDLWIDDLQFLECQ